MSSTETQTRTQQPQWPLRHPSTGSQRHAVDQNTPRSPLPTEIAENQIINENSEAYELSMARQVPEGLPRQRNGINTPEPDEEDNEDDNGSIRTQMTHLERKDLNMFDVAALIMNKMIGTGIFVSPGVALALTQSKTISIVLWFFGGIWAFLSVLIYVEFGAAFPFNGGELIYLDEVTRRPELLATVLVSMFYLFGPITNGNAIQFAKHVLLAANPDVTDADSLDHRMVTLLAILVLTFVCLLHYFSRNSGLLLNLCLAGYKFAIIIVLIVAGIAAYRNSETKIYDWGPQTVTADNVTIAPNPLAALIYILYSYQGWENANYVGGEFRAARSDLKWGAFMAVTVVTLLYILVTMSYALICSYEDLTTDLSVVLYFAPKVFGSSGWLKVCIALSAFGNILAVVYTASKVKQQVARQCIIPFYKFFGSEDKQFETPKGALILHWAIGVVWIIATPNSSAGYDFVIGFYIYGQLFIGVCVGVAYFFIRPTYEGRWSRNNRDKTRSKIWEPVILKSNWIGWPVVVLLIGMDSVVLVQGARAADDWKWPTMFFSFVLGGGFLYWAALRYIERVSNSRSPLEIRILKIVEGGNTGRSEDQKALKEARLEGNNRILVYQLHGNAEKVRDWIDLWSYKLYRLIAR